MVDFAWAPQIWLFDASRPIGLVMLNEAPGPAPKGKGTRDRAPIAHQRAWLAANPIIFMMYEGMIAPAMPLVASNRQAVEGRRAIRQNMLPFLIMLG